MWGYLNNKHVHLHFGYIIKHVDFYIYAYIFTRTIRECKMLTLEMENLHSAVVIEVVNSCQHCRKGMETVLREGYQLELEILHQIRQNPVEVHSFHLQNKGH